MKKFIIAIVCLNIFFQLELIAKSLVGIERFASSNYLTDYEILEDKLIFSITTVGIMAINLETSEYLGVYNDPVDYSNSFNSSFVINGNKILTTRSKVFDINTFKLLTKFYDTTLVRLSTNENYIYAVNTSGDFLKLDNTNCQVIESKNYNLSNQYVLHKGNLIYIDTENNVNIVDKHFNETSFKIESETSDLYCKNNYIIIRDKNDRNKIFDFKGNLILTINLQLSSNIDIDENSNYTYFYKDFHDGINKVVRGQLSNGAKESTKFNYTNSYPYYFEIMGKYKDYYVLYEKESKQLYKSTNDFKNFITLSKFNGRLMKIKRIESKDFQFAFLETGYGGVNLKLLDTLNNIEKSYSFQTQLINIFHPIYNFTTNRNFIYIPIYNFDKFSIVEIDVDKGTYNFFGDFKTIITGIHIEENEDRIYVTSLEDRRYIFKLSDKSLEKVIVENNNEFLSVAKIDGKVCVLVNKFGGMEFRDFENGSTVLNMLTVNNWRYGYQFILTSDNRYFLGQNGYRLVIYDLLNKKLYKFYEVDLKINEISSLAITDDLSFITIGTYSDGLYEFYPNSNTLISKNEENLLPIRADFSGNYFERISDINIDKNNRCYYYTSEDLIFTKDKIESIQSSVFENMEKIKTLTIRGGILELDFNDKSQNVIINDLNGKRINFHKINRNKIQIESEIKFFLLRLIEKNEIKYFKLINEGN